MSRGASGILLVSICTEYPPCRNGTNREFGAAILRYFNPVGADKSGRIEEDPNGVPNNLVPYISKAAVGNLDRLSVFGDKYETRDGTGERDYIHVEDLARAHSAAIDYILNNTGCEAFNVGTGSGTTVLEMIETFENASGRKVHLLAPLGAFALQLESAFLHCIRLTEKRVVDLSGDLQSIVIRFVCHQELDIVSHNVDAREATISCRTHPQELRA